MKAEENPHSHRFNQSKYIFFKQSRLEKNPTFLFHFAEAPAMHFCSLFCEQRQRPQYKKILISLDSATVPVSREFMNYVELEITYPISSILRLSFFKIHFNPFRIRSICYVLHKKRMRMTERRNG